MAELDRIADSCGYAVPVMELREERDLLTRWAERKTPAELAAYRAEKNAVSMDGLPRWAERPPSAMMEGLCCSSDPNPPSRWTRRLWSRLTRRDTAGCAATVGRHAHRADQLRSRLARRGGRAAADAARRRSRPVDGPGRDALGTAHARRHRGPLAGLRPGRAGLPAGRAGVRL